MDNWRKTNETTLPEKEQFYSNLNIEFITDVDYMHGKKIFKDFGIKNLDKQHDLYLKRDTLPLSGVFENFREMCLKIYQLNSAKFIYAPGLAQQAALKKTKVELDILTVIDKLLMVRKGIRGGICNAIYQYTKANNKYMEDYDKNKESSFVNY